jgi:hypothetical protein
MALDTQPKFTGTMRITISLFLTANKFCIELSDGQLVDAVMIDDLLEKIRPYYSGPPLVDRIGVIVEFREHPAMHRIVEICGGDGWCGPARAERR